MIKGNTSASIDMPRPPADFPKLNGYIIGLEYVPKGAKRNGYENEIREWCRKNPDRRIWPAWLVAWPETKKRLEAQGK